MPTNNTEDSLSADNNHFSIATKMGSHRLPQAIGEKKHDICAST